MNTAHLRPDPTRLSPDLYKKYLDFSLASRLDEGLALLVDVRASQINACAFCLDMHVKQARLHGERELRLHHLATWRESPLFTPRERAALAWTERLTQLPPHGIEDADYGAAREHFDETELAELSWRIVAINGWNRLNVAFRTPPGSKDKVFGLDKAGLA